MLTKEIGKVCTRCYVLNRIIQNTCIDMVNVHGVVDESSHSSWTGFPKELGNLLEHNIRNHRECVQHHSKINQRTFRRNFECGRPGIFVTIMDEIGVGQQVGEGKCCVCADSVLCVGWMEDGPRAAERRWKGQVEDLRMYSSHQDAVGIHGEVIEFEWTFFPGFSTLSSVQEIQKDLAEKNIEPENFQDRMIFMSMFNDILWKTGDEKCIFNAEKVKNYAKKFTRTWDISGSRVGRERW